MNSSSDRAQTEINSTYAVGPPILNITGTVQIIGLLAAAVIGIAAWMSRAYQFEPKEPLPFRTAGIALQLGLWTM